LIRNSSPPAGTEAENRRMEYGSEKVVPVTDPTRRFSSRVESYVKYRPGYPNAVIATLRDECQLGPASFIADIGAGTGLLTQLFLQNGNPVFAVEPNPEMRAVAERLLQRYSDFRSVAGKAEASTLADRSVEFVVAGQAFHWFDRPKAQKEFARILKPTGWVMLVWNQVELHSSPFLQAHEHLLQKYAMRRPRVDHRERDEAAAEDLFGSGGFKSRAFRHSQRLDHAGVQGRVRSLSTMPEPGHPDHEKMLAELAEIFRSHEVDGTVEFRYVATMFYGRLGSR
jgi:ubiquinone/menaquinone biosynthesis C-methylase UbiE